MSTVSSGAYPKGDLRNILAKQNRFRSEESVFCTEDNLEPSLHILSEVMRRAR